MTFPARKRGRKPHPLRDQALELAQDPVNTLSDIAAIIGCSIASVSRWVSDAKENPPSLQAGETDGGNDHNSEEPLPIVDGPAETLAAVSGETKTEVYS